MTTSPSWWSKFADGKHRIGKLGMGPFSITGQPNAMGGREVGGMSNQLAAHMELENPEHRNIVQQFWNSPKIADRAGLKAIDLFEAIDKGDVKGTPGDRR